MERELDDELRFHLEHEARKLEASGLGPDEAMRQARLAFGGVERIKDDTRDVSGVSWLEIVRDRTSLRDPRTARAASVHRVRRPHARLSASARTSRCSGSSTGCWFALRPICAMPNRVHRLYLTTSYERSRRH